MKDFINMYVLSHHLIPHQLYSNIATEHILLVIFKLFFNTGKDIYYGGISLF